MELCKWPDPPLHCHHALKAVGGGEGWGRGLMESGDGATDPCSAPFKVLE